MEKIKNIQQATEYVYNQLKEINPDIEKDDVYDTIMDEVLESIEYTLTDEDVRFLEENEKNLTADCFRELEKMAFSQKSKNSQIVCAGIRMKKEKNKLFFQLDKKI